MTTGPPFFFCGLSETPQLDASMCATDTFRVWFLLNIVGINAR